MADPTQETCATAVNHGGYTDPTRRHELLAVSHTIQGTDYLSAWTDLQQIINDLGHDLHMNFSTTGELYGPLRLTVKAQPVLTFRKRMALTTSISAASFTEAASGLPPKCWS